MTGLIQPGGNFFLPIAECRVCPEVSGSQWQRQHADESATALEN
jgi:hypothetical protein